MFIDDLKLTTLGLVIVLLMLRLIQDAPISYLILFSAGWVAKLAEESIFRHRY